MAHSYNSEYPSNISIDPEVVQFFETFYQISDTNTAEAHEKYVDSFTKDATLILASKTANSHQEILTLRKAMWAHVVKRQHTIPKVFPFGANASEFMLHGTVVYEVKGGRKAAVDWGARAQMVRVQGCWKLGFYQVYLDTAALQNAR